MARTESICRKVKHNSILLLDKELVDDSIKDPMSVISPWGRSYIVIDSEGNIFPYSLLLNPDCKIGNIKNDDLIDIWRNAELLKNYVQLAESL